MKNSKVEGAGKEEFASKKDTLSNSLVINKNNSKQTQKGYCGRFPLLGPYIDNMGFHVVRILCKTNGCPYCWAIKLAIRKIEIAEAAKKHRLRVFATLTIPNDKCTAEDSVKYIQKCWNRYRSLKRHQGNKPDFISVLEFTKKGYAHLHVLLSEFIPWAELDRDWKSVGGGHVDVKGANENASRYLAKYLTKRLADTTAKGARLVNCSRSIKLKLREPNPEYKFHKVKYADLKSTFQESINEVSVHYSGVETGFYSKKPIVIED